MVPYKVVRDASGAARVDIKGKQYSPPEISAQILMKLKQAAEAHLGEKVTRAVITVPAVLQRRPASGDQGGGQDRRPGGRADHQRADRGGARLRPGQEEERDDRGLRLRRRHVRHLDPGSRRQRRRGQVNERADTHLGGDNLDQAVINWLVEEFKKDQGIDLSRDQMVMQRLKEAGEKAKIELSSAMETEINLPFITADASGPKHMNIKLNALQARADGRADHPALRRALSAGDARREGERGPDRRGRPRRRQTRMPRIQQIVKDLFKKEPHRGVNPDEVVAVGAAIQGGVLRGEVKDVLSARRDAALARHRDPRRRDDEAHRAQHHDPDAQERDLLDGRGQPDERRDPTSSRASARWPGTTGRLGKCRGKDKDC